MRRKPRPLVRRNPSVRFEALEGRRLLAGDVVGTVFNDTDGDGVGDMAIVGQPVLLYRDNGNGTFSTATDTLVTTVNTTSGGAYRFENVDADDYFVVLGTLTDQVQLLPSGSPALVTVSDINLAIDDFTAAQTLTPATLGSPQSGTVDAVGIAGGERDLFAEVTAGAGDIEVESAFVNSAGRTVLSMAPGSGVNGRLILTWDGNDNNATSLAQTLGLDLSQGGANTSFALNVATDKAFGTVLLRAYSGAGNFSTATVELNNTDGGANNGTADDVDTDGIIDGTASERISIDFTSFVTSLGTGASFSNVTALELEIDFSTVGVNENGLDAEIEVLGVIGDTPGPDFTVQNVMSLGNLVFLDQNNDGMFMAPDDIGIGGVVLNLLFDADRNGTFTQIDSLSTATTGSIGSYLFAGLAPGDYQVEIDPTNFIVTDPNDTDNALIGLFGSTGNDDSMGMPADPDDGVDDKDRGFADTDTVIRSKPITLVGGQEVADNGNEAQNVDFGFWGFDLKIDKTPATQVAVPGETVSYTLTPSNARPGTRGTSTTTDDLGTIAEDVQVVDLLPLGLIFEAGLSTPGASVTTVNGRQQVTYAIGDLSAGATGAALTVVARVDADLTAAPTQANEARISNADEPAVYANEIVTDNLGTAALTFSTPSVAVSKRSFFWSSGLFG